MTDEEKEAIDWLKDELDDEKKSHKNCNYSYKGVTGLYGNNEVEIALKLIEKQQKEIEKTTEKYKKIKEKHKKIKAVFKKYALDEQDWFVSTSDIIKFVKDMRKSMGIGE